MLSALEWALEYIRRGWPVLPLYPITGGTCSCPDRVYKVGPDRKKWKCSPGKHPFANLQHGVKDATLDEDVARLWWGPTMWPNAGVGIALVGAKLLDVAPDGVDDLADFIARGLPDTLTFRSGGGEGHQHFLYRLPDTAPRTRLCLPTHYDIMSDGYCVAPPTVHESGGLYRWLEYDTLTPGTEPPLWALELLHDQINARTPAASASVPGEAILGENGEPPLDIDQDVWEGDNAPDRSSGLWAIAGELAAAGANEETIVEALRERDQTLGWHKYADRKDAERRYRETARRQLANVMPRIHLNGTVSATTTTPPPMTDTTWPAPLGEAAYHGPLGEVVRGIEPYVEADPAAILAHALGVAGTYVGTAPHTIAGAMPHPARLYVVIVGDSSRARKGTAAAPFRRLRTFMPQGDTLRFASGLSSSEGLIRQVRDKVEKWNAKKQDFETTDPGVSDKRLWVLEGELATLLRRMEREGNAISATMRDAWDHGHLETLVTMNPMVATNAHIGVVAHITRDELLRYLHPTELASGFANRFQWFAARRSKLLPRSQNVPARVLETFMSGLEAARKWANKGLPSGLAWSDAAGKVWDEVQYPYLVREVPGMFGQAIARAEAQVVRLAVLYATLDCSVWIELQHLEAALAVWKYCEASARWIFGDRTGDEVADKILLALRDRQHLTRTEISALFNRHKPKDEIDRGLQVLLKYRLASMQPSAAFTAEVWTVA